MTTADLFAAIHAGEIETVETLLQAQPEWKDARNDQGDSALLAAAYAGRRPIFELLLRNGAGVNLFEAAALGLEDRVKSLVAADAGAVAGYSHDGWTALHLASFFGHADVARLLLRHGADVNARSRSTRFARENTPLHAAAANRQTAVAGVLLDAGAEVNAKDGSGHTPLALAAASRNDLMVVMLLERGALAT